MSRRIRVLFYITPPFRWKYIVNWLITIWTMSKYSHCEIWTPDDYGEFRGVAVGEKTTRTDAIGNTITSYAHKDIFMGTAYTATMRGKANGTVSRPASEVLDHPGHWDFVEIELGEVEYEVMVDDMQHHVDNNNGYATWDLLKFVSPIHFPDNSREICSEFVNNSLWVAEVVEKRGIISPKTLAKKLQKKGHKIQELK